MKKLNAIIVDDELPARENMRILLNDYCPEIEVIGTADGVKNAKIEKPTGYKWMFLKNNSPDLKADFSEET